MGKKLLSTTFTGEGWDCKCGHQNWFYQKKCAHCGAKPTKK